MTIWKDIDGWTYEYFDRDTPASEFSGFEEIVELWKKKRGDTFLPAWNDFDAQDLDKWQGQYALATIFQKPFGYRFDFFGEKFIEIYEEDWTGKVVWKNDDLLLNPEASHAFRVKIAEEALLARVSGMFPFEHLYHKAGIFLELPLSDDGKTVTHSIEFIL